MENIGTRHRGNIEDAGLESTPITYDADSVAHAWRAGRLTVLRYHAQRERVSRIKTVCGGRGVCKHCKCRLVRGGTVENPRRPGWDLKDGEFLACQTRMAVGSEFAFVPIGDG